MTGRKCKSNPAVFGEMVWYRTRRENFKSDTKWEEAIWVGMTPRGETSIIGAKDGRTEIVWAVRRKLPGQRWNVDKIQWVTKSPEEADKKEKGDRRAVVENGRIGEGDVPENVDFAVRGVRIKKGDYEQHGYADGCLGCQALRSNQAHRSMHTKDCRARMIEAIGKTEEGKARINAAEDRWIEEMARRVEQNVRAQEQENEEEMTKTMMEDLDPEALQNQTPGIPGETAQQQEGDAMVDEVRETGGNPDVTEVYSPPRVIPIAEEMGLKGGSSMDLLTGWDFSKVTHRRAAFNQIRTQKPLVVIGSPMCTMFSTLQNLNPNKHNECWNKLWVKACRHMEFMAKIYDFQISEGRFFVHENPANATSWNLPCIDRVSRRAGVKVVTANLCAYGMTTRRQDGEEVPAKKPTKFMTNAECVAEKLQRRCSGTHTHQQLTGERAAAAAVYPEG